MTQYEKMTETNVKALCTKLAIPTVISMLVTSIYNIADTSFVSKLNDSASAAISIVFSLMTLIQSFGFTIGMGCGSLVSMSLGKKKDEQASKYASQAILMGLIIGILLLVFGLAFNDNIMKLLGASQTSKPYAAKYAKWIFIASPFMMLSFIMNNILRSEGKAKFSMIGLALGGILNIGFDPLFIYGFDMGISGAGLSTMISQIISFLVLSSFFISNKSTSKIGVKYLTLDFKSYLETIKRGLPTLFRQGFATSANIILSFLGKPYGDAVVGALGITAKIYAFVRSIVIGIGQGYQPVLGFNFAAKKFKRVREAFSFTIIVQSIICVIGAVLVLIMPTALMKIFTSSSDIIEVGKISVRALAVSLPFLGFSTIVNQSLQVTGYSKSASFLASLRQGIVYTPVIFIMELAFNKTGLCLSQTISDLLTAIITIPFYFYFIRILKKEELNCEVSNG